MLVELIFIVFKYSFRLSINKEFMLSLYADYE